MTSEVALLNLPVPQTVETILTVSPNPQDHAFLQDVLEGSNWNHVGMKSRSEALPFLRNNTTAVVVTTAEFSDGAWKDVLADLRSFPNPPNLIVTSDCPDEHLWAEVLNVGGYDVLAKPFHPSEILRIVSAAWRDWRHPKRYLGNCFQ